LTIDNSTLTVSSGTLMSNGQHRLSGVIPRSKEIELKLPYVCPGTNITRTVTHRGKIDAMFNYLIRVLFSSINDPGVSNKK
jgi:hypothetical protein